MQTLFKLLNSTVRPLTPAFAEEFRGMEASPTERELDQSRVKYLRDKAQGGLLTAFHWAVAHVGNKLVRVNGQHSSTMLCGLNGNFPDGLVVHYDEYKVENVDGLALLFRQFDDRKSSRSAKDVAAVYQGLYEPLNSVPKATAKLAIEGIAWYRRNIEGTGVRSGDDVYQLFGQEGLHPFICWVGELITRKSPEFRKPAILAAMYATHEAHSEEAKVFWDSVARMGDQYNDRAPATVLDAWLRSINDPDEDDAIMKYTPGELYQGCIFAWNAYRAQKDIEKGIKFRVDKAKGPLGAK